VCGSRKAPAIDDGGKRLQKSDIKVFQINSSITFRDTNDNKNSFALA
jgi:hypothetical protein